MLTKEEKEYLLKIARQSIELAVKGNQPPQPVDCPENLLHPSGAFVTIHKFGDLRGCIGFVEAVKPLVETIIETAAHAAINDPRFLPLSDEDLEDIEIEISVLSSLKLIKDVNEIQVGEHGIFMEEGFNRGLLLPQVATEYSWDRETFLNQTARKARLPINAWKKNTTKIWIFTAEIFNEVNING